ncbi:hypothetical protein PIB30_091030 [Stylosanthes scabra]|uniref:Uncharacterized protein n=1 Tax=Stylosanthes scabra TaxID=79078 RepID=A0ABU6ZTR5_9FABA|nr:hypothetical protein [Stylosanthes scabra]
MLERCSSFLGGLGGIGSHSVAESLGKVAVVAAGNSGAVAACLLHCLLPLKALVHLHHHPLAVVVANFLIVLGKLKSPLLRNPCAITAMLSAMISSARTSSPLIIECISMALATVISDLFPVGTRECMVDSCQPRANGCSSVLLSWMGTTGWLELNLQVAPGMHKSANTSSSVWSVA